MSEFKDQLLMSAGVSPERIMEFSCGMFPLPMFSSLLWLYALRMIPLAGHVIPPDHLLPVCLCKGPSGVAFDFTYQNRDSANLVRPHRLAFCSNKQLCSIQFSSEIRDWLGARYIYQLLQHHCINMLLSGERFSDTNLRSLMF